MLEVNNISTTFDCQKFVQHVSKFEYGSRVELHAVDGQVIPSLILKKRYFNYANSLPFGLYSPVQNEFELEIMLKECGSSGYSSTVINIDPTALVSKHNADLLAKKYGFELKVNHCHLLDTTRPLNEIFYDFGDTRKKHIKRYQKSAKLKIFKTSDPIYFDKYFALYQDSMNRWGLAGTGYSKEMLADLYSVPGVSMWVAEYNGQMLSGMICFYYKEGVFDWLAASIINEDVKKLYAPVAVQFEVIRHASENGFKYVNMGASINLNGVSHFKDSWGARQLETYSFYKSSRVFKYTKNIVDFIRK